MVDNDSKDHHNEDHNLNAPEGEAKKKVMRCGASWEEVAAKAVHKAITDRKDMREAPRHAWEKS